MKASISKSIIGAVLALLSVNSCFAARIVVGVGAPYYPPYNPPYIETYNPPYYEAPPYAVEARAWVPDHWENGYWIPGHYVDIPEPTPAPGYVWIEGGWGPHHHWHHGHWAHHH